MNYGIFKVVNGIINQLVIYMSSNELKIDTSTYLTIIIGQLGIYGILLTFYQFAVTYQWNEKSNIKYLGIDVVDFYLKENKYLRIVSRDGFVILFILEIVYYPIVLLIKDSFSKECKRQTTRLQNIE